MTEYDKTDADEQLQPQDTHDPELRHEQRSLYRHRKRQEWGMGMLVWEAEGKRGYQFEDGELRVFKDGFFEMLERVEATVEERAGLMANLEREVGRTEFKRELEARGQHLLTFDDQLSIFRQHYPGCFDDPAWVAGVRGEGAARQLKKHRAPVTALAQARLGQALLAQQIDQGELDSVWEAAQEVLDATNLVTSVQLKPVRRLEGDRRARFVHLLRDLLYGTAPYGARFDSFVVLLDRPGWELATALPALVHPDDQVCIKPSTFCTQAQWMAPDIRPARTPAGRIYERYLSMAMNVRTKLQQAGLNPRDLLDVHDFIWATLRPAARKGLPAKETLDEGAPADDGPGNGSSAAG